MGGSLYHSIGGSLDRCMFIEGAEELLWLETFLVSAKYCILLATFLSYLQHRIPFRLFY
jgi:hypothetical protein